MAAAAERRAKATAKDAPAKGAPRAAWPADKVKLVGLDKIRGSDGNPRLHSNAQVDQIAAAIKEFGWTVPIVVDEAGEIVAGHGRALAARRMGLARVPVVVAEGWTPAQKKAYRIWDNQSTLLSEWSPEMLRLDLGELKLAGYELELTGFDAGALVQFMASPQAPGEFPAVGADIATEHSCPKCGYRWSGKPDAAARPPEPAAAKK